MTSTQSKAKVVEITQFIITPFKNDILGDSWIKYFRNKHLELVLRVPQALNPIVARALNLEIVAHFFPNLESLYIEHQYDPNYIWNIDKSGHHASKSGLAKVFAKRGITRVHQVIP